MRLANLEQCRALDTKAQSEFGLSGEILMEGAGSAAALHILGNYPIETANGRVTIVCGPGHNGGDGLVVARWLACRGMKDVRVLLAVPASEMKALTVLQHQRLKRLGVVTEVWDRKVHSTVIEKSGLLVDALLGIGIARPVSGAMADLIGVLNRAAVPVVSLDIPSGLNGDTGWAMGACVRAHQTLTFGPAKPGFFLREGPKYAGRVKAFPISFPSELVREIATTHFLLSADWVRRNLPKRTNFSNKSNHGRVVICAGSDGKVGAAFMAGEAAFRVGAGYVVLASFDGGLKGVSERPEIMTEDLAKHTPDSRYAYCVGPGLGTDASTNEIIRKLHDANAQNVVLDADALTVLAQDKKLKIHSGWILTPHSGELARLLGSTAEEIEKDPIASACAAAKKYQCAVLLKGFHSVLVQGEKAIIIPTGNSSLAKAGTGDVLTGMIGGFMAQGLNAVRATAMASFLHGLAADQWLKSGADRRSLLAMDICTALPNLLKNVSQGHAALPTWATL